MKNRSLQYLIVMTALFGTGVAQAHPGHGAVNLFEGLFHPFAFDHLLVMLAVGVWSVCALPAHRIWFGPIIFLFALACSSVLGALGVTVPLLEHAVALSVVLSGAMLWMARWSSREFAGGGLALVALMGSLHGLAHGVEAPAGGFVAYAAGFLVSTTVLHILGLVAVVGLRRLNGRVVAAAIGALGAAIGLAGAFLLGQVGV